MVIWFLWKCINISQKKFYYMAKWDFSLMKKFFFAKKNSSLEFFSESSPQNSKKRDYRAKKYYAKKSSITWNIISVYLVGWFIIFFLMVGFCSVKFCWIKVERERIKILNGIIGDIWSDRKRVICERKNEFRSRPFRQRSCPYRRR
jgi:hypothetical protein